MERRPLPLNTFDPAAKRFVDPASPVKLRTMAAKGLAPLQPRDLVTVLYQLTFDQEQSLQQAARETLKTLPEDVLVPVLGTLENVDILDWISGAFFGNDAVLHAIISNLNTVARTVVSIGRKANAETCDVIAENQVRLLENPQIIEVLYMNPEARMSTMDKLVDLARRNGVELKGLPALRPLLEASEQVFETRNALPDLDRLLGKENVPFEPTDDAFGQLFNVMIEEESRIRGISVSEKPERTGTVGEFAQLYQRLLNEEIAPQEGSAKAPMLGSDSMFSKILQATLADEGEVFGSADADRPKKEFSNVDDEPEGEDEETAKRGIRSMLFKAMPISQRIRVAILGSAADRELLIRDSNRLVYMSAATSPKVTAKDAITWAGNPSIPEEIIQFIGNRREWLRSYQIKVNLVFNPKAKLQMSLRFIPHLLPNDLKLLSRSKQVPQELSRRAKALISKRQSSRQKR